MTENQLPTFWITGYLPNGCKVSYTVPIMGDAYGEALLFTDTLLSRGFTTVEPGLNAGESGNVITTVMRRAKSDGTPIIDFFTEWGRAKEGKKPWGTFKYLHLYMNSDAPEMVEEFLKVSGFKSLESIPLYDAQAPLQRTEGKPHPKETAVPTPFKLIREQGEEKIGSDGQPYRPWNFVRYELIGGNNIIQDTPKNEPQGANAPSAPLSSIDDKDTTWNTVKTKVEDFCTAATTYFAGQRVRLSGNDIFGAINIVTQQSASRWSELTNITQADAWAACLLHVANGDKSKALIQVINDPVLTKAVNFWSSPGANIEF